MELLFYVLVRGVDICRQAVFIHNWLRNFHQDSLSPCKLFFLVLVLIRTCSISSITAAVHVNNHTKCSIPIPCIRDVLKPFLVIPYNYMDVYTIALDLHVKYNIVVRISRILGYTIIIIINALDLKE